MQHTSLECIHQNYLNSIHVLTKCISYDEWRTKHKVSQLQEGQPEASGVQPLHNHHREYNYLMENNFVVLLLGKRRGGRWHAKGLKQASKGAPKRELRTTDEILRLRKKTAQNKYKQMSKSERAKKKHRQSMVSQQTKNKTGKRRKR